MPMPTSAEPLAPGPKASLDDWLGYLEAIHPVEIDLGLDRVLTVYRRLFPRPPAARVVTVAGTNGKGSTVACLSRVLAAAGRTVGCYTSPHLHRYNERVVIDGRLATDDELITAFAQVEEARRGISLSYFEFGTLAAFVVLARAGVQDWVLEVGLGGRLDAVNVVDADLAIITSVDIDHVAFLGNDREVIGFEKAGIFRVGRPAICVDPNPPRSVLQQAAAQRVALKRLGVDMMLTADAGQPVLSIPETNQQLSLPGDAALPLASMAAAVMAALTLQPEMTAADIETALAKVHLAGRFEQLARQPDVYLDVGHNPHAAAWLATRVQARRRAGGVVRAVYACLADKDAGGVVDAMAAVVQHWYLAGLDQPRGRSAETLAALVSERLGECTLTPQTTVADALKRAMADAAENDLIVVFGSFFTVAEARVALGASDERAEALAAESKAP